MTFSHLYNALTAGQYKCVCFFIRSLGQIFVSCGASPSVRGRDTPLFWHHQRSEILCYLKPPYAPKLSPRHAETFQPHAVYLVCQWLFLCQRLIKCLSRWHISVDWLSALTQFLTYQSQSELWQQRLWPILWKHVSFFNLLLYPFCL